MQGILTSRTVYTMGKASLWTPMHDNLYIVWKALDAKRDAHGRGAGHYRKCAYCDSLNSLIYGILDFMKTLD